MYTPAAPFNPQGDVLRHYNEKAQDAEYVALQNYGIDDLTPLMPQLAKLTKMRHLNLSGNNLSRLPDDLSSLIAVETLDISRNAFNDAESVVAGLYTLPHLLHLKINLPEQEENKLVATLTSVQTINGVLLDEDDLDPDEQQRKEEDAAAKLVAPLPSGYSITAQSVKLSLDYKPWTGRDTERYAKLYEAVGAVSGKVSLPEEYRDFSRTVMSHFHARTSHEADTLKLQVHQFNAQALLLEFSFDELVRVCTRFGADVGGAMQGVFESHLKLIRMASVTMAVMQEDRDRRIAAIQEDLRKEILLRERTQRAYEASFGATVAGGRMQYNDDEMRKGPVPLGLSQLYPSANAMGEVGGGGAGMGSHHSSPTARNAAGDFSDYYASSAGNSPHGSARGGGGGASRKRRDGSPKGGSLLEGGTGSKIQLAEIRNFIKILVKSKAESDEANAMARLPPETLEQHIYTLLCSKTGRAEVVKSRIQSIYDAVALYAKTEIDVEIIHRVLEGQLDEAYVVMHQQHEGIVYDTISMVMKQGEADKKSKGLPMDELLDERQSKQVIELVVPWPVEKRMRLVKAISAQMRRKEFEPNQYVIHYKKLAYCILKFLLAERMAEVKEVSEQFRATDRDRTGVIDINHFKHIIMALFPRVGSKKAQQLAVSADPFDNNVVNFNTAVRVTEAFRATEQQEKDKAIMSDVEAKRAHLVGNIHQQQQPWPQPPQRQSQHPSASQSHAPQMQGHSAQPPQQGQQYRGSPPPQQNNHQVGASYPVHSGNPSQGVGGGLIHYAQRSAADRAVGGSGMGGGGVPSLSVSASSAQPSAANTPGHHNHRDPHTLMPHQQQQQQQQYNGMMATPHAAGRR